MNRKKKFEWYGVIRVTAAILIALLIAAAIIFAVADDPGTALYRFLLGPFSTKRNFFNVIETMIPLVFCGLAINVMHKSGLFSMVADSSFYFAGVMAATLAIACPMPNILHQIVILAVAMAVGGVIGIIPVLIKRKTGANELVISLMMNYIFFNFGYWLIRKFFLDTSNGSFSIGFQPTATLGKMLKGTNTHYGLLIMIAAVIIMWILMDKSKFGRELKITGSNENFAKYAGIKVGRSMVLSMTISGALAGLAGVTYYLGYVGSIQPKVLISTGFDAIAVSLLGNNNPFGIVFSTMLITLISKGSTYMKSAAGVDAEIASVITGIILLFSACNAYIKWKMERNRREKTNKTKEDK